MLLKAFDKLATTVVALMVLFAVVDVAIFLILGRLTPWTHVSGNHRWLLTSAGMRSVFGQQYHGIAWRALLGAHYQKLRPLTVAVATDQLLAVVQTGTRIESQPCAASGPHVGRLSGGMRRVLPRAAILLTHGRVTVRSIARLHMTCGEVLLQQPVDEAVATADLMEEVAVDGISEEIHIVPGYGAVADE